MATEPRRESGHIRVPCLRASRHFRYPLVALTNNDTGQHALNRLRGCCRFTRNLGRDAAMVWVCPTRRSRWVRCSVVRTLNSSPDTATALPNAPVTLPAVELIRFAVVGPTGGVLTVHVDGEGRALPLVDPVAADDSSAARRAEPDFRRHRLAFSSVQA